MSNFLPETSHLANEQMTSELRERHKERILVALGELGLATGEEISRHANMDYHAVMRRVKELVDGEKIYNTLTTGITSTGRKANKYAIRTPQTVIPSPEKHYAEGITTAADIACSLIAKTSTGISKQKSLFGED